MTKEQIKQYYERIEILLKGGNKQLYGFTPEEIRYILNCYEDLELIRKKLFFICWYNDLEITNEQSELIDDLYDLYITN